MRQLVIGEQFGNWTVIGDAESLNERYWKVQCNCGLITTRRVSQLTLGRTNSCRTCAAKLREEAQRYYTNGLSPHILTILKYRGKELNLTFEDILEVWNKQEGKCRYTGIPLHYKPHQRSKGRNTASIDRIDSSKGYIKGNIQFVHKRINTMKNDMSEYEFLMWCKLIMEYKGSCGV